MHVHCVSKLRLACAERAKLGDLTRFGSWSAERRLAFGHGSIMTQARLSCSGRPAGLSPAAADASRRSLAKAEAPAHLSEHAGAKAPAHECQP
jgi:hypothetical protein